MCGHIETCGACPDRPELIESPPITSICAVEGIGEDGEDERAIDPDAVVGVEGDGEHFQYHSGAGDLDLAGEATDRNWSIRCVDVVKRLAGIPVLNGLNVAGP